MRMAERRHPDPGQQVQVLAPLGVVQPHALAADEHHRLPAVGLQHVALLSRLDFLGSRHGGCHSSLTRHSKFLIPNS